MKKQTRRQLEFYRIKEYKARKIQIKSAKKARRKQKKLCPKVKNTSTRDSIRSKRREIRMNLYKKFRYKNKPLTVEIKDELGIEKKENVSAFFDLAEEIIDFDSKELKLDLRHCTRMWPSGVTMLCSFVEWLTLANKESRHPIVLSNTPYSSDVATYLSECGFYEFVGRTNGIIEKKSKIDTKVKIRLESDTSKIDEREDEIQDLIINYSMLNKEQIELFINKVLIEIFSNVTEHGIASNRNMGYWVLGQYHGRTGIISLCIADNGIGIRNSLMTGPQRVELASKIQRIGIENNENYDGEFIRMALEESVSGALSAFPKTEGLILKQYEKGSRRGNGLSRIRDTCRKLGINLSILSQNGYALLDSSGNIYSKGSRLKRIFAGTMYHMSIPAQRMEG
ncbi:MAG: hypothetical protein CVU90_02695 [Firmicutes bacterium HGW-Firmicutes-15]|nr:MAG: hypothetical protein CVU90_02695 [Firmicutes bacterium HGW-Firmicutes-15]